MAKLVSSSMERCWVRRTDILLSSVLIITFAIVPTLGFVGVGHSNARILPFADQSSQTFCGRIRCTSSKGGGSLSLSLSQKSSASEKKSLDLIDARIREAEEQDLKAISNILTFAFFGKFNPLEWLQTYFSLQDSFPEAQKSELYCTFVAYRRESGKSSDEIIGYCEVDCRPNSDPKAAPRPYMCNLAVKDKWKNNGIGTALIEVCEEKVTKDWCQESLHLRVRRRNSAALGLYKKMGYLVAEEDAGNCEQEGRPNSETSGTQEKDLDVIMLKKVMITN